jgi:uncharacterized peroxidase-related enzyme
MSRLQAVDPLTATGKAKTLLDAVQRKLGLVPMMTRVMAASPVVLESYLGISGALAGGRLDARMAEQIALVIAQENGCDYCLSAHSAIARMVGLNDREIAASRTGAGVDDRTTAALTFAIRVLATKGRVDDADVLAVRDAGYSDGDIAEIIAHVALNVFTNYFNTAAQVDIDFPKVSYSEAA